MKTKEHLPENECSKLYKLNNDHIADLLFFDDEIRFLNDLLNKYFTQQLQQEHLNRIKLILNNLTQLHLVKENIVKDVLTHQGNLAIKLKDIATHDIYFFKLESERILQEMNDLNKSYRSIKKEIFSLSKSLITEKETVFN